MTDPVRVSQPPALAPWERPPRAQLAFQLNVGPDARYLIARVTGRPVHVGVIIDGLMYEAAFSGVRAIDAAERMRGGEWELLPLSEEQYDIEAGLEYANAQLGKPYDLAGATIAWWFGRPADNGRRDALFCSEYASGILRAMGRPLSHPRHAWYTPRRLFDETIGTTPRHAFRRHLQRVGWWLLIASALALALAPLLMRAQPAVTDARPLPKACWPASQLRGRDTVYLYLPCNDLRMLDSTTRAQLACTVERMQTHGGWPVRVFETYRSDARQYRLYLQGRPNLPGGRVGVIVTNAKSANLSAHGALAGADLVHARDGWSNPRFFTSLELHAFECGLEAGASWKRLPDGPHVQNRAWTAARKRQVGGPS